MGAGPLSPNPFVNSLYTSTEVAQRDGMSGRRVRLRSWKGFLRQETWHAVAVIQLNYRLDIRSVGKPKKKVSR